MTGGHVSGSGVGHILCARCGTPATPEAPRCPECGADPRTGVPQLKAGAPDRARVCQGVWIRALALGIDGVVLFLAWLAVSLVAYLALVGRGSFAVVGKEPSSGPLWLLAAVGGFAYFWICGAVWGRTLGMRLCGLRVVAVGGGRAGVAATLARTLLLAVDWLPVFFILGAVLIWLTPRHQRLGDLAARTVVVRTALVSVERLARGGPSVVPWTGDAT